jgi:hypothetical protein
LVGELRVTATPNPISNGAPKPGEQPSADVQTALLDPPGASASTEEISRVHPWLHRISVFLFVLISAVAGVLLVILPWTPEWTDNYLLLSYPDLRTWVSSGFFRGICSGLGLLDIWIGFWEALHYHERK